MRIVGMSELAEMIETDERLKKAQKGIERNRVKQMVAEGVDPKIAKTMVKSLMACGL